jgi:hypothetical protein
MLSSAIQLFELSRRSNRDPFAHREMRRPDGQTDSFRFCDRRWTNSETLTSGTAATLGVRLDVQTHDVAEILV